MWWTGYIFFFSPLDLIILPRKSVYRTVSGVIEPQIRALSSSASKHSPRREKDKSSLRQRKFEEENSCIRHIVKICQLLNGSKHDYVMIVWRCNIACMHVSNINRGKKMWKISSVYRDWSISVNNNIDRWSLTTIMTCFEMTYFLDIVEHWSVWE